MQKGIVFNLILLIGIMCMPCVAQHHRFISRAAIDSLLNPPMLPDADRYIRLEQNKYDIGTIPYKDTTIHIRLGIENIGLKRLEIDNIQTSCGCTRATCSDSVLNPGMKSSILVTYNSRNRIGNILESIYIYTSLSKKSPIAKITITGKIDDNADKWKDLPYRMGDLRMKRNGVTICTGQKNNIINERIWCANNGDKDIRPVIKSCIPYMNIYSDPEIIAPGTEADIIISVDKSRLPQKYKGARKPIEVEITGINEEHNNKITVVIDDTKHNF